MKKFIAPALFLLLFFSCQQDPDQNLPDPTIPPGNGNTTIEAPAIYLPNGFPAWCDGMVIEGPHPYTQNEPLTRKNYLTRWITVTQIGTWVAYTNTVNGMQFAGTGTLNTLGSQRITLYGSGVPLQAGTFNFTVNIGGAQCDGFQVTVNPGSAPTPAPTNIPPQANAGPDKLFTMPGSTKLFGSGIDPDGTVQSYHWSKLSGPTSPLLSDPGSPQTSVSNLAQGIYTFELKVTDNKGATGKDTVQLQVQPQGDAVFKLVSGSNDCSINAVGEFLIGGSPATSDQFLAVTVDVLS